MDNTIILLNKLMDVATRRHRVLANNLANVNTPGFERKDIRFKESLSSAIEKRDGSAISAVKPDIYTDKTQPSRPDGNNVSTQKEMGEIMENELLYRFSVNALSSKLSRLKKVIGSGQK